MVDDPHRTPLLAKAIRQTVKPGHVAADIGCGTGILSFIAAQSGAAHVYAIDCDKAALDFAKGRAKALGLSDRITFIHGLSQDVQLPKKVDLLLCEIVGSLAFDENILASLLDARRRFLKPGGRIIPEALSLFAALARKKPHLGNSLSEWKTAIFSEDELLSQALCLGKIDTRSFRKSHFQKIAHLKTTGSATLGGILLWPKIVWKGKWTTDCAPSKPLTHWKQGYLPLEPKPLQKETKVEIEVRIGPHPDAPLVETEILWRACAKNEETRNKEIPIEPRTRQMTGLISPRKRTAKSDCDLLIDTLLKKHR